MTTRSEAFGRLLKAGIASIVNCEGKTATIVEDELGQLIGISGDSIQRYKSGHLPPEDRTVEILATAAVQRGYLGREWLQRFLHAARYPFADKLLDRLCPIGPERPRPPRVYENLPAPTYSQFIMRTQAFAEIAEGLSKRSAAVLIVGLGGNGKTSLAREVAARCLQAESHTPKFDAVTWVSDKDRPGTTTLSIVLDEIARTLDYPGFAQFEHEEKHYEVEQLLRRQRVLVVVDNFETITDGALLNWLLNLPEPSKALITTREYRREFRRSSWPVDLRGMTEEEARALIVERARVLKIEKVVGDLTQLEPLLTATSGNPKAIEMTMGLLKYERRSLQQIVDDLYAARGELFDDLFTRAWTLLDEAARQVLLVMTFFPASASGAALSATAAVQSFAFDRAVECLSDLALLDVQQADLDSMPRYTLHSLVQAFAVARIAEMSGFERGARERWVGWFVERTAQVGYCWNDLERLHLLEGEVEGVVASARWAFSQQRYTEVCHISENADYYLDIRGYWGERLALRMMAVAAAHHLADPIIEIGARCGLLEMLTTKGDRSGAATNRAQLQALYATVHDKAPVQFEYHAGNAFCAMGLGNIVEARQEWQAALDSLQHYPTAKPRLLFVRRWIVTCLLWEENIAQATTMLQDTLAEALRIGHQRTIVWCRAMLASVALSARDVASAEKNLAESLATAVTLKDNARVAIIQHLYARLHTLRGDLPAARAALAEAIDFFERLGMRRELTEARAELARLDEHAEATS